MFLFFKSKTSKNLEHLEMCINFLTFKVSPERAELEATKVAFYIWMGLSRMFNEGVPASYFAKISKTEAQKIMGNSKKVSSEEFIESARNSIPWIFFEIFDEKEFSKSKKADLKIDILQMVINYLCLLAKADLVKKINDILKLNLPDSTFKNKIKEVQPHDINPYYSLDKNNNNHLTYAESCNYFNNLSHEKKMNALNFFMQLVNDSLSNYRFRDKEKIVILEEYEFALMKDELIQMESIKAYTFPLLTIMALTFNSWRNKDDYEQIFEDNWSILIETITTGEIQDLIAPNIQTWTFPFIKKKLVLDERPALNPNMPWPYPTGQRP